MVANCGATSSGKLASKVDPKYGVTASPRVVAAGDPVPKGGGTYRVGKAYQVAGRTYVPQENNRYKAEGLASWYGDDFHGRLTANGEVFDMESIAAAHPTLPMPSYVRITNLDNRKSLIVRVNDRGPYHADRVIDVSQKAADLLGFKSRGTARVRVEYAGRAPLEGSDDRKLMATLRQNGDAPMPSAGGGIQLASNGAALPTARMPSNAPMPPDRPFDLGAPYAEPTLAAVVPQQARPVQVAALAPRPAPVAAPVAMAAVPVRAAQPAPVAVAPQRATQIAAAPLPPAPTAAPNSTAAPKTKPVLAVPTGRPLQVASAGMTPAPRPAAPKPAAAPQYAVPTTPSSIAASGWMVGPQPVAGYAPAGVLTPVSTGSGLY